jgi:hypothetical protein
MNRSVDGAEYKRESMLEAVADVARYMPPSDLEILKLACSIEESLDTVNHLHAAAAFRAG